MDLPIGSSTVPAARDIAISVRGDRFVLRDVDAMARHFVEHPTAFVLISACSKCKSSCGSYGEPKATRCACCYGQGTHNEHKPLLRTSVALRSLQDRGVLADGIPSEVLDARDAAYTEADFASRLAQVDEFTARMLDPDYVGRIRYVAPVMGTHTPTESVPTERSAYELRLAV